MTHLVVGDLTGPEATVAFVAAEPTRFERKDVIAFADAELARSLGAHAEEVDVSYRDGTLTLSGTVHGLAVRDEALETVARLRDVDTIVDELELEIPEVDDQLIRERVERRLRSSPAIDRLAIDVAVEDAEVRLRGRVGSMQEQRLALDLARRVLGVAAIDNQLFYEPTSRDDPEVAADVRSALTNDLFLGDDDVEVDVDDGRVTLSGSVSSLSERRRAEELAWVAGVVDVHAGAIEIDFDGPMPHRRRAPTVLSDTDAERQIERVFLYDVRVPQQRIDVRVRDGVVALTGVVQSYAAKDAAHDAVKRTRIGQVVDNRIEVNPSSDFTDAYLTQAIERALAAESVLAASDVSVEVVGQKATLRGVVDSLLERRAAMQVASDVAGITEVNNQLETKQYFEPGIATRSEVTLARAVRAALLADPWVTGAHLVVSVDDGEVTLTGVVDDELALRRAVDDAHDAGAATVTSQLIVTGAGIDGQRSPADDGGS